MIARPALAALGCALVTAPAAFADGTVRLDTGRATPTALVAMDLDGRVAALYPRLRTVRVVVAVPDASGAAVGGPPQEVPVARGAVVEGLGLDAAHRVLVVARSRNECSEIVLIVRDAAGIWSTSPLGGAPARAAALAVDPAGVPGLVSVGCAGEVSLRRPDAVGTWVAETVPATAGATARPALTLGAAGAAALALDGEQPVILSRSGAGVWSPLPLPDRPLFLGERVTSLRLATDASGAVVAAMTRAGPLAAGISGTAALTVTRRLDHLSGGAWSPVATGGPDAIDVAGLGDTWVARRRDGRLLLQHGTAASVLPVDAIAVAAAPGGRVAYVPRGAPSVLGIGVPPTMQLAGPRRVRFGEPAPMEARLSTPAGAPLAGVRVRGGGVSGVTDVQGRVTLRPVVTRSAPLEVAATEPGPSAPVRTALRIAVRPQPVALRASLDRTGLRPVVRGSARGGAALPGPLGRVYVVDLATPGRGFLPGRVLASFPGGRSFGAPVPAKPGVRLALFFKGALLRLR